MYQVMSDSAGNIYLHSVDDDLRNARRPTRRPRPNRPPLHGPLPTPYQHMPPMQHMPVPYPPMPYPPMQPHPVQQQPQGLAGMDMRTGMKALGAILPGLGHMLGAFRRAPEKPEVTGEPVKDLPILLDYISDVFDHNRTGDQMAGVLATTGAMLEILGTL